MLVLKLGNQFALVFSLFDQKLSFQSMISIYFCIATLEYCS